jgi:hypothetical protein
MSVVVVAEIDGGTQELYESVQPNVMPDNKLPDGCQAHIAGPTDGGWRVITVWDSEDSFNQFRNDKLIPALQEAGEEQRVAPNIVANEVHNFVAS